MKGNLSYENLYRVWFRFKNARCCWRTTAWFGIRFGETSFAIFDTFPDDAGRDAHLSGKVAKALMEKASELLAEPPKIEKADVLADRLPG
jgi:hypothetical protein